MVIVSNLFACRFHMITLPGCRGLLYFLSYHKMLYKTRNKSAAGDNFKLLKCLKTEKYTLRQQSAFFPKEKRISSFI